MYVNSTVANSMSHLKPGSLAIDHGGSDCEPKDQRRVKRHHCDIGAYERG